jgi:biotin carboxyl carrier protein
VDRIRAAAERALKRTFRWSAPEAGGEIAVELRGDRAVADVDGRRLEIELRPRPDGTYLAFFADGRVLRARVDRRGIRTRVRARGRTVAFDLADPREAAAAAGAREAACDVVAAMPGRVVEVRVRAGDEVVAGQVLLILEAMKMQNEISAEAAGRVSAVCCEAGQAVDGGTVLVRF